MQRNSKELFFSLLFFSFFLSRRPCLLFDPLLGLSVLLIGGMLNGKGSAKVSCNVKLYVISPRKESSIRII